MSLTTQPPSIKELDGVACAAIGDAVVGEPFAFVDAQFEYTNYAAFYELGVLPDQSGATSTPPRYMLVRSENRVMVVGTNRNQMKCRTF